jgi:hypothetical protein
VSSTSRTLGREKEMNKKRIRKKEEKKELDR